MNIALARSFSGDSDIIDLDSTLSDKNNNILLHNLATGPSVGLR